MAEHCDWTEHKGRVLYQLDTMREQQEQIEALRIGVALLQLKCVIFSGAATMLLSTAITVAINYWSRKP